MRIPRRKLFVSHMAILLGSLVAGLMLAWSGGMIWAQDPYLGGEKPDIVPEGPRTPEEQAKLFHLPPGFEIELVASEPQIANPLSLRFDAKGRLWITDTLDYPYPPKGPGNDSLKVLEDRDGDGRYETVTTLVDKLSMPTGATPIPGGAIVFSIPSIYGCHDTDGDGRIDERKVLYTEFGNQDAHGMNNGFTRWLDGWIYACHGYTNTSHVQGSDGQKITMVSGNGYRFRIDGSRIEHTWRGQVNPYGLVFDPLGNLFTADCHSKPAYCLLRGAYYPGFQELHDGLGLGPKLIDHSHGSTSISGIAYYAADQFPEEYRDCVFMGNSVTGCVNNDEVHAVGSSLRGTEKPDFAWCEDRWFRPVEIAMGPDGALYVADFYDCIIGYYEVPLSHPRRDHTRGRVWRIYYKGTPEKPEKLRKIEDLTQLNLEQLWQRMASPNLCVRTLATHEIFDRFAAEAQTPLRRWILGPSTADQRAHGLWILERLGALDDELVQRLADDEDRLVRVHLVRALGERPDWDTLGLPVGELVRKKLFDPDAFVRRAAADALGRHARSANVPLLLRLWAETPPEDDYLIHTVRMALRDHLKHSEIFVQHAQLTGDPADVHRLLDVVLGVRNTQSAEFVLSALRAEKVQQDRLGELIRYATRYLPDDKISALVEYVLGWQGADAGRQLTVFRSLGLAMQERGSVLTESLQAWGVRLVRRLLADRRAERVLEGILLAGYLRSSVLYDDLAAIAASKGESTDLRIAAVESCVASGDARWSDTLDKILGDMSESFEMRQAAAVALSRVNTDASRQLLLERLKIAPHRMAAALAAALIRSPEGAEVLLGTIAAGKASPLLLRDSLILRRLEHTTLPNVSQRIAKLTENLPPQDEMIAKAIRQRREAFRAARPDAKLGEEVFIKQCAICHQMEGEGKEFGPGLEGIGVRGLDRLLEDLLDPNRNVDPLYRSTVVITDDGLTRSGLALRDEGNVLLLVDTDGKELRILHDEIEERFTSPLSPMPNAAEKTVNLEEFSHLMQYLLSAKAKPKEPDAAQPSGFG